MPFTTATPSLLTYLQVLQEKSCNDHVVKPCPKCIQLSPPHPVCLTLFLSTLPRFLTYSASVNSTWWIRDSCRALSPSSCCQILRIFGLPAPEMVSSFKDSISASQFHKGKSRFFKTGTCASFFSFHWPHQSGLLAQCHVAQIPVGRLALISGVLLIGCSTLNRSLYFPSISSSYIRWIIITSALRMAEMTNIK